MIENKFYIRYRLIEVHKRYMSIVELGPVVLVLRKDGSFEPTADEARSRERAAQSRVLLDNYTLMLLGTDTRFWHQCIPDGQKLYFSGKAKPSAGLREQIEKRTMEELLEKFIVDNTPLLPPGVAVAIGDAGSIDLVGRWREMP